MIRALLAFLSFAVAATFGASFAQAKPAKAKDKPPVSITVENKRPNTLNALQVVLSGAKEGEKETVVATLPKALPTGKKTAFKLKSTKGCAYVVRWQFDDQTEADEADINLCKDGKIVLTD